MANMFVVHLRRQEEIAEEGSASIRRSELIQWYLSECSDIETERELIAMKGLCEKVIDRLVHTDNVMIALQTTE